MKENQTYYYLKLKEGFFDGDGIKLLESMDNGYLYSNILLKMYLKSLRNNGCLLFNDYIPYNVKMLSTITGHNPDIVKQAIDIFNSLGLIEQLDNGAIFMLDIQQYIGSISTEGKRKAMYRERIRKEKEALQLGGGTNVGQSPNIIYNSNSVSDSVSVSISNSSTRTRTKKNGQAETSSTQRFVKPTVEDIIAYCSVAAITIDAQRFFDFYESKGWKVGNSPMKDWKAAVRNWARRDASSNGGQAVPTDTTSGINWDGIGYTHRS